MSALLTSKLVSKIGLGCVTFGREIDEAASHALMDHAFARGVSMFDTAAAYGQGASEQIIGRWLASRRPAAGKVTVATKILPPYDPDSILRAVDASRTRLGVDTIGLLYLHRWDPDAISLPALSMLDSLVRQAKILALGVSNWDAKQLMNAAKLQQEHGLVSFSAVQNNHNFAVSDITENLREFCAARQIAIVTYSPLGAGFLTGKHNQQVQPESRFDLVPGHQAIYFNETSHRRLAALEAVAARSGHSQVHLALAWVLHQPGVTSVLVGGRTPAHLDQAFAALSDNDAEVLTELDQAWHQTSRACVST
ncbi:MAG: aldo/keto reductase [Verrucomicrobiota bacterium]